MFRIWGLGFRVEGLGFRLRDLSGPGLGSTVSGLGEGLGFRVEG